MKISKILKEARTTRSIGYQSPNWGRQPPDAHYSSSLPYDMMEDAIEEFLEDEIFNHDGFVEPLTVLESRGGKWVYDDSRFMQSLHRKLEANNELKKYFGGFNPLEEVMMFSEDAKAFISEFDKAPVATLKKYAFVNDIEFFKKRPEMYDRLAKMVEEAIESGDFYPKVMDRDPADDYDPDY